MNGVEVETLRNFRQGVQLFEKSLLLDYTQTSSSSTFVETGEGRMILRPLSSFTNWRQLPPSTPRSLGQPILLGLISFVGRTNKYLTRKCNLTFGSRGIIMYHGVQ